MNAIEKGRIIQPLNPADYFTLAMDDEIRRENMPGSLCGFALLLDTQPDIDKLASRIDEFTHRFPLALASLQQQGNRFYWCTRQDPKPVFFRHHCPEAEIDEDFQRTTLTSILNSQEPREITAPIEFHLVSGRLSHCFLLRWIHPFCDARGIELILKYLCTEDKTLRNAFDSPKMDALTNVQLDKFKWWQKIQLFYKANRYINQLDRYQSILHGRYQQVPSRLNALSLNFNEEQTALIAQNARKHCGLTGTSLYYIGCLMRALFQLEPDQPGEAYCVPYAFNLRKQKAITPVLGNHIGALFAQAPKGLLDNREQLFNHLKQQNAQVLRQKLDYAFLPVMWAASWLSLKKYGHELRCSYKNGSERSSFWFSDIGQLNFERESFFDADISRLLHFSQISSPPGLAVLCCQYRKQLTLSYNFNEPIFSESWIAQLHEKVAQELLEQSL